MQIRSAIRSDRDDLRCLEDSARDAGGAKPYVYADPLDRGRFYPWAETLVCETDQREIIGAVTVSLKPLLVNASETIGHIFGLRVRPENQRQGVGKKLLAAASKMLEEMGAIACFAYVGTDNKSSQGLFRSFGFASSSAAAYLEVAPGDFTGDRQFRIFDGPTIMDAALDRLGHQFLAPLDLATNLFSPDNSAYHGSLMTGDRKAGVSVWDKDAWLERTKPGVDGLFVSGAFFSSHQQLASLLGDIARRTPQKNKLTLVVDDRFRPEAMRDGRLHLDRIEDILVRWKIEPEPQCAAMFLDIRD